MEKEQLVVEPPLTQYKRFISNTTLTIEPPFIPKRPFLLISFDQKKKIPRKKKIPNPLPRSRMPYYSNSNRRLKGSPRFELYNIVILNLDSRRTLSKIFMCCMPIFRIVKGQQISIGESLTLIGPSRPPANFKEVLIWFGRSCWNWSVTFNLTRGPYSTPDPNLVRNTLQKLIVSDEDTDSRAQIRFAQFEEAVVAELEFQFVDDDTKDSSHHIEILEGDISATNDGNPDTKRFIRRFGGDAALPEKRKNQLVPCNYTLQLDRSAFSLPLDSQLCVSVQLNYLLRDSEVFPKQILHVFSFKVPPCHTDETQFYGEEFPKLSLNVKWFGKNEYH